MWLSTCSTGRRTKANGSKFKRAVFEWCGMGAFATSLGCLGYWAASLISDRADSVMSFRQLGLDVSLSDGAVTVAWSASVSLLFPAVAFALIAAVCIRCWIRAVKELAQVPQSSGRQETPLSD
jgi:hypothetical protein